MSAGSSAAPLKQTALNLQLKLPCATLDAVCARYGPGLSQGAFFVRTSSPRPAGTLVRLEARLSDGSPCLRAAATVDRAIAPPEADPGMELKLLAVDEAGRALLARLGGPVLRMLKSEAFASSPSRAPRVLLEATATPAPAQAPAADAPREEATPSMVPRTGPGAILGVDLGAGTVSAALVREGRPRLLGARPLLAAPPRPGEVEQTRAQLVAGALRELRQLAERVAGAAIGRAVITVAGGLTEEERQLVVDAAALAGLKVERLLTEPIAAALAFANGRPLEKRLLVYDLGGTSFYVALLALRGRVFQPLASRGDRALGGLDFDTALADHLRAAYREQRGHDFPADREALTLLHAAAERAKVALSTQLEVRVHEQLGAAGLLDVTVSRSELVLLTGELIERTLALCREVMAARGLFARDLDEVLLVGGQSRMPLVRERLRNLFGVEPSKEIEPGEAVALGAALLAHELEQGASEPTLLLEPPPRPPEAAQEPASPPPAAAPFAAPALQESAAPPAPSPAAPPVPVELPSEPAQMVGTPTNGAPGSPRFDPAAETAEMQPAQIPLEPPRPADAAEPRKGWLRNLFGKKS